MSTVNFPKELIIMLDNPHLLRDFLQSSRFVKPRDNQWASTNRMLKQWSESIYKGGMRQLLYYLREFDMYQDTRDIVYRGILQKLCIDGSSRFLDAGCGAGQLLHAVAERSPNVTIGIDPDPIGLTLAHHVLNQSGTTITLKQGSITALPFEDGYFSAIACRSVLVYVDREKAMSELARCLQKRGFLYLRVQTPRYYLGKILIKRLCAVEVKSAIYNMLVLANYFMGTISPRLTIKLGRTKKYRENPITLSWLRRCAALNGLQILEHEFNCTAIDVPDVLLIKP